MIHVLFISYSSVCYAFLWFICLTFFLFFCYVLFWLATNECVNTEMLGITLVSYKIIWNWLQNFIT